MSQVGTPQELVNRPADGFVASLMATPKRQADQLQALVGHALPSAVRRAGARWQQHPVPADFEQTRQRALARG